MKTTLKLSLMTMISGLTNVPIVSAALEQVSFTDTSGNPKSVDGRELNMVNIRDTLTLKISSGLDRKIQVRLQHGSGLVESQLTAVINIHDRLNIDGKDFYGKEVVLSKVPQNEGEYTVVVEYLDLSNAVVSTESYTFVQDTIKPVISGQFVHILNAYYGHIDNFGHTGTTKQLEVSDISDNNGISRARYWVKQPDGSKKYKDVEYNLERKTVIVAGSIAATTGAGLVPAPGYYQFGIDVYDTSGNVSTLARSSHMDFTCPATSSNKIEVRNAQSGVWESYHSGMTIYSNPVSIRYGRLLSQFATNDSPYGWKKLNHMVSNTDSTYAYYQPTINYPQMYSYFHFYTESGHYCSTYRYRDLNFNLAAGVDMAPKFTGVWHKTNLSSEWITNDRPKTNVPYTINAVRVFVEPRSYRQKLTITAGGSCYVNPGATSCDISTAYVYSTGRGYSPYSIYTAKEDGSMNVHGGYLYTYWDFNPIAIRSIDYDRAAQTIMMQTYDADTVFDWRSSMWRYSSISATANIGAGPQDIPVSHTGQIDLQTYDFSFDVSALDVEMNVPFVFKVIDSYGNETNRVETFTIDTVKPKIQVMYSGEALPEVLSDIRDLEIHLEDFSEAVPTSVQLLGSDAEENVYLAVLSHGDGLFRVAKPKIFPTLNYEEGERYKLIITAEDEQKNVQNKEISFGYEPDNLIVVEAQPYVPANQALYDVSSNALARIYTEDPLIIEGGQRATGPQTAEISNRKDSDFAISIVADTGIVNVLPGETKAVMVDLGPAGDLLEVEVFPSERMEGTAQFMFSIPSLSTIY